MCNASRPLAGTDASVHRALPAVNGRLLDVRGTSYISSSQRAASPSHWVYPAGGVPALERPTQHLAGETEADVIAEIHLDAARHSLYVHGERNRREFQNERVLPLNLREKTLELMAFLCLCRPTMPYGHPENRLVFGTKVATTVETSV
jgi:hypothetical protein